MLSVARLDCMRSRILGAEASTTRLQEEVRERCRILVAETSKTGLQERVQGAERSTTWRKQDRCWGQLPQLQSSLESSEEEEDVESKKQVETEVEAEQSEVQRDE